MTDSVVNIQVWVAVFLCAFLMFSKEVLEKGFLCFPSDWFLGSLGVVSIWFTLFRRTVVCLLNILFPGKGTVGEISDLTDDVKLFCLL